MRDQIDIKENNRRGEIFKPLSDNFIYIRCKLDTGFHGFCTHLIYDFDKQNIFRIGAFTTDDDDPIQISSEQTEDFTAEIRSTELFIDTLLLDETEGDICFWGSKLGVISMLTTVDFSVKWENYREERQKMAQGVFSGREASLIILIIHSFCFLKSVRMIKNFFFKLSSYKIKLILQVWQI